ncbi:Solute carrier family 2, facilitated glucose transporter member 8-like [Oopsacas minuta]|uniref:Solute carrier family 2, facilitated glucose transporter member 8-like n=1 Tax=Oopsacas minuta TaxID=111878 RepID=A0AAV7JGK2_9METZ|nr:Solute carrier family 2, facilitated glucose transporter member 8-like [Oopsacas minuta]
MAKFSQKPIRVFVTCSIALLTFGLSLFIDSYTSPIEDEILSDGILSENMYPVFASMLSLGGLIGAVFAGPITECFGIKSAIIFVSPLAAIGGFGCIVASSPIVLVFGRMLIGMQIGVVNSTVPIYISEISSSKRKLYGSVLGLGLRMGTFIAYTIGLWLGFRWIVVFYLSCLFVLTFLLSYQPDSPHWLHSKGYTQSAIRATAYLHECYEDLDCKFPEKETHKSMASFMRGFFALPVIRPLIICCSIQIFKESSAQQLLLLYAAHTLEAGVSINPQFAAIFNILSQVFGSIIFLWVIQKIHWKKLVILTTIFQAICNALLAVTLYLSIDELRCTHSVYTSCFCGVLMYAPLIITSVMSFAYGIGWGSIVWWLYGEILDKRYARVCAGIATFCTYLASFLNQLFAPILVNYAGSAVVFFGYSCCCVLALVFQYFY